LQGGSNDIGAQVQVSDPDLGVVKVDWRRIDKIEFMDTPSSLESAFGEPLYGVVKTIRGEFEGYLQWDHDERLTKDVLNGRSDDGEMDIEFGKIKSIERGHKGSIVTLKSGRSIELRGSNDVDSDNRGIIVSTPNYGRVDISWDEFEKMEIHDNASGTKLNYSDYNGSNAIRGVVSTFENENHSGRIIYDLDETYQLEMLDGVSNNVDYFLPFATIKSIEPKNRKESLIQLRNGEKFILSDKVDVSENNDGVLVFGPDDKPTYVPWSNIKNITFE